MGEPLSLREQHRAEAVKDLARLRKRLDRASKAGQIELHVSLSDLGLLLSLAELAVSRG